MALDEQDEIYAKALAHINRLFYQEDGTLIPAWRQDPSFNLQCWNATMEQQRAAYTRYATPQAKLDACREWYRAMKAVRDGLARHTGLTPDGRQVAYPLHCGQPTQLSVLGWRCGTCGEYQAFTDTKTGPKDALEAFTKVAE